MSARTAKQKVWTASNVITLIRILLVPVFVAALLAPWPQWFGMDELLSSDMKTIIAAVIFVLISTTDWLDGYLARSRNEVTDFGKFMDPLADKILVAAALIALVELDALPTWVVLIILAREFIVSGIRMIAASRGVVIAASMIGKFKTVFQMIAIVMFTIKDTHLIGDISVALSDWFWVASWIVMLIALALTIVSLADYLVKGRSLIGLGNDDSNESTLLQASSEESFMLLDSLATTVVQKALAEQKTIGCAESLTGGLIGTCITAVPGSSAVFKGGIISYVNSIKHECLQVPNEILEEHGAVSEQTASMMATGARESLKVDVAVAVTGIAGPTGAEPDKPVGTVWIGISSKDKTSAQRFLFKGNRFEVRTQTAAKAFELLLLEL